MSDDINATLAERGKRYGKFTEHARVTQHLKAVMRDTEGWQLLADDQCEALEMIAHKVGRMLCGDSGYEDSVVDIIGYATLMLNGMKERNQQRGRNVG